MTAARVAHERCAVPAPAALHQDKAVVACAQALEAAGADQLGVAIQFAAALEGDASSA